MKFVLPELKYDYSSLEPHIDARTMEIHHTKHHNGYVTKLNAALESAGVEGKSLEELLGNLSDLPEDIRIAVGNNGGGHYNHSLFWDVMGSGDSEPDGDFLSAIESSFGSFENMKKEFSIAAGTRFGSGWVWLGVDENKKLVVCSTANQDNPLMRGVVDCECAPILGLDVWEHAYYLSYQNRRPDYVSAWWSVVDWEVVGEKYVLALNN